MAGVLRRYTDVLSLLDILHHNRLTLLSPTHWYDQNDASGLKQYSDKNGEGSVYALCLAEGREQAHHWQIFAGHTHGLCIQFDKDELIVHLNKFKNRGDILHGPVLYRNLKQIAAMKPLETKQLPFLKRATFKAEAEYRVVAWNQTVFAGQTLPLSMPATLIQRVILGPSMPDDLAQTLREVAARLNGCSNIKFTKSRMVNNASWAKAVVDALAP